MLGAERGKERKKRLSGQVSRVSPNIVQAAGLGEMKERRKERTNVCLA